MNSPYQVLGPEAFWRTGVVEAEASSCFNRIWCPKYSISKSDKILTAGSCFAQHISRWLIAHDYEWIEAEETPSDMVSEEAQAHGYGVFSFRTGNIYTTALLRQWVEMAFGCGPDVDEAFEHDGRFFDPLRPLIPETGYGSTKELAEARHQTLQAMKQAIVEADIFVFTLGLIEGWRNRKGYVYPLCPGTAKGSFDPETMEFFVQTQADVVDDLTAVMALMKTVNPSLKFLFTVSPVPLTATASQDHVLVATIRAKATLRSAVADLGETRTDVDYFPSYELIASAPMRARYYAPNQRSVVSDGVDHVMRHFERGLSGDWLSDPEEAKTVVPAAAKQGASPAAAEEDEVLCEDVLLETWNANKRVVGTERVCLLGDSHMGNLSASFERLGIPHVGGLTMVGSAWTSNLLHLDKEEYFVPLYDAATRSRWCQTLPFFGSVQTETGEQKLVVSNLGQQTHRSVGFYGKWLREQKKSHSDGVFRNYFIDQNKEKLSILKRMVNEGYKVVVVTDPPLQFVLGGKRYLDWEYYEKVSRGVYFELGCDFISLRELFAGCDLGEEYFSEKYRAGEKGDWFHGGVRLYDEVALALSELYGLQVQHSEGQIA